MAARIAAFAAIALAAVAALLFGIAGRFDWAGAWLVLALSAAYFLVSVPFMLRRKSDGLDGYRDYTARVVWRLAPGIW